MLHEALRTYLKDVEKAILSLNDAYIERYEEEILTQERTNLRIRVRFQRGYLLELNEAVIVHLASIEHLSYRYHLQDAEHHLVFRYDDTPHFPKLKSFPHHKHEDDIVIESIKPSIIQVIAEAQRVATINLE